MKKTVIPIRLLKLNEQGVHLAIQIKINGKKGNILVDTGASNTVFDKKRITAFIKHAHFKEEGKLSTGLGTSTMESHTIRLKKIQLGTIILTDYPAVVLDLSHVNKSYATVLFKPIDGVLGGDILRKYKGLIDYGKKVLILYAPQASVAKKKRKSKTKASDASSSINHR